MPTIQQWTEQLLGSLQIKFDFPNYERGKDLLIQGRANRLRQSIEKYGTDIQFRQKHISKITNVDIADTCVITVGCDIKRSENPIPIPIRYKSDIPFLFVGSIDGKIAYTSISNIREYEASLSSRYMSKLPRYYTINNYNYYYNLAHTKYVREDAIFENPLLVRDDCNNTCFKEDTDEFPIALDMMNSIIQEIISTGVFTATKQIPIPFDTQLDNVNKNS